MKVQNSILPDASITNTGSFSAGFKIFNFNINDSSLIDENFGVYIKLNHPEFSDLQVELISPTGSRQMLIANQTYSQSEKEHLLGCKNMTNCLPHLWVSSSQELGVLKCQMWQLETQDNWSNGRLAK
ncbi:proprotein convertase P-domain-containing protein [Vibrio sinaloensis]|nr:proprotein convertase P-domain-containing protein [Vibrio sinaloensis]